MSKSYDENVKYIKDFRCFLNIIIDIEDPHKKKKKKIYGAIWLLVNNTINYNLYYYNYSCNNKNYCNLYYCV